MVPLLALGPFLQEHWDATCTVVVMVVVVCGVCGVRARVRVRACVSVCGRGRERAGGGVVVVVFFTCFDERGSLSCRAAYLHQIRAMSLWTWPLKNRHCNQMASAPLPPPVEAHTSWCRSSRPATSERAQSAKCGICARPPAPTSMSVLGNLGHEDKLNCALQMRSSGTSTKTTICSTVRSWMHTCGT